MESDLDEGIHEKCGVSGVKIYNGLVFHPPGGAAFYCVEAEQDLKNRGEQSTGIAAINQERLDEGDIPIIKLKKKTGNSYQVFGSPGTPEHLENCAMLDGDTAIGHNRYDTSTRGGKRHRLIEEQIESILGLLSECAEHPETIDNVVEEVSLLKTRRIEETHEKNVKRLQAHPFVVEDVNRHRTFAFAFNGNITNWKILKEELTQEGTLHFKTNTDTEIIRILLEKELEKYEKPLEPEDFKDVFSNLRLKLDGAYTLAFMDGTGNLAFWVDKGKYRPAVYATKKDEKGNLEMVGFASETSALNRVGFSRKEIREVEPDSFILATNDGLKGPFVLTPKDEKTERRHCIFELIYFAKAISKVYGIDVHLARRFLGIELARAETNFSPLTFVSPIPSTPIPILDGYVEEMKNIGLVKLLDYVRSADRNSNEFEENVAKIYLEHNVVPLDLFIKYSDVRTFITENIAQIGDLIGRKHFVSDIREKIKVNEIVERLYENPRRVSKIFEDSIVRGNTIIKNLTQIARHTQIEDVDFLVGSPPVRFPCYDGIDMPTVKELIAYQMEIPAIVKHINKEVGKDILKNLTYLSCDAMTNAIIEAGKMCGVTYIPEDFCRACFDGNYRDDGARILFESARG